MAAVILHADAESLLRWDYRTAVGQVADSGRYLKRWQAGSRPDTGPGTEAWLLVHGGNDASSGLIGHGLVVSEPYQAAAAGGAPATDWFVAVSFDALLPLGEQIRPGVLLEALPGDRLATADGPALVTVPPSSIPVLRRLWRELGPTTADPTRVPGGTLPPGSVSDIQVNRCERDPETRRACLAFHGTSCAGCGFAFETAYGEAGAGMMAVHHVVPPGLLDSAYQLDPVADLIPLCHNCHAVVHAADPPHTVAELRTFLAAAGHVKGEVVTDLALQSQEDARRILDGGPA